MKHSFVKYLIFLVLFVVAIFIGIKVFAQPQKKPTAVTFALITATSTPTFAVTPTIVYDSSDPTVPESELTDALNAYRQTNHLSILSVNQDLCQEAQKRLQDLESLNVGKNSDNGINLSHAGIQRDWDNGSLVANTHKTWFGENLAYALCKKPSTGEIFRVTSGAKLIECFDSSPEHKANLMNPKWTDVCTLGKFPYYIEIFAY